MSPSKSPNKSFYRAFGIVVGGLSVGILILALLVSTSGPRVRHVEVQSPAANGSIASVNQGLSVVFDRAIASSSDFESAVNIEPKTEFTVSHRNQQLNITFEQNLLSNTDYVLTINPLLEDDLGRQMKSEYTYEFSTAEPSFSYLERNYEPGAADKIIERSPLSGESQVFFGAEKIKLFGRNANYLAVVVPRADSTDEVRVVDLATVEERPVEVPSNMRIDNLKFSPTDNQFVFSAQAIPTTADTSESSSEASGNTLYRYDIDSDQLQPIADMGEGVVQGRTEHRHRADAPASGL